MTVSLRYGVRSDVGHVRTGNEDSGYAGSQLVAVADGMGGAAAGEVASRVVINALSGLDEDIAGPDVLGLLSTSLQGANAELRDMVAHDKNLAGMGTTATALLVAGQRLGLVHIGDSRCYLFRDGVLTMVTRDHTFVQELVDSGEISEDEAAVHPKRSLLMRVLDGREGVEIDLSAREARIGDRYLLCSDGLSVVVSADTIAECLALPEPQAAADRLVDLALRGGGPDNITAVVADVIDGDGDDSPTFAGAAADDEAEGAETGTAAGVSGVQRTARRARGLGLLGRQQPDQPAATSTRRWLLPVLLLVLLLALVGGGVGGWAYVRGQYYVGVSGDRVAIYRGVSGSVGPLHLSSVTRRGVLVSALTPESQRQVRQHINADNRADARRILAQLNAEAGRPTPPRGNTRVPSPAPTPTQTPRFGQSPTPTGPVI